MYMLHTAVQYTLRYIVRRDDIYNMPWPLAAAKWEMGRVPTISHFEVISAKSAKVSPEVFPGKCPALPERA